MASGFFISGGNTPADPIRRGVIMKIVSVIFITDFILLVASSFAAEPYALDKIVVKPKAASQSTITSSEIRQKNPDSLVDLLNGSGGLDLRYRGTSGIQADTSLRGSTYEEAAIAIDGINLMDPQTGHHNLDIPLTGFDVERIDITKEGASSSYGAGALAGAVNFVTKKPDKQALYLDAVFGQHALFGQGFSFSLPHEFLSSRVSFEHKISKAARPNTDFEYQTASCYLNKDTDDWALDNLFGYQKKDFGADSFYSNLFPEEEEHTETIFDKIGLEYKPGGYSLKNSLFFRKHRDKFILRRNNPASVNYHTTFVYGLNSQFNLPTRYGEILLGMDAVEDQINSVTLGKHSRSHEAGFFGFTPDLGRRFIMDLKLRGDCYQKWGWQESFNFNFGYKVMDQRLKLKCSAASAFRVPTFTELYYSDAANRGDPNLKKERANNFILGAEFKDKTVNFGLDAFLRRLRSLIDWTRASSSDRWQAANLGRVDFYGLDFNSKIEPGLKARGVSLDKITFAYTYMSADKKTGGLLSKYAMDILQHQFITSIYHTFCGISFDWQLTYNRRYYGEDYFVGNIYLSKKIIKNHFNIEPFVRIDNFNNTKYTEVSGVLQPGRWIKSGLRLEW